MGVRSPALGPGQDVASPSWVGGGPGSGPAPPQLCFPLLQLPACPPSVGPTDHHDPSPKSMTHEGLWWLSHSQGLLCIETPGWAQGQCQAGSQRPQALLSLSPLPVVSRKANLLLLLRAVRGAWHSSTPGGRPCEAKACSRCGSRLQLQNANPSLAFLPSLPTPLSTGPPACSLHVCQVLGSGGAQQAGSLLALERHPTLTPTYREPRMQTVSSAEAPSH